MFTFVALMQGFMLSNALKIQQEKEDDEYKTNMSEL